MSRILATTFLFVLVGTANATITADHHLWESGTLPIRGAEFFSYRIRVDVSDTVGLGPDDWTAAGLDANITGGVFFQHPYGSHPPNPDLFPTFPDLEFDSYYTTPGNYPNTDYQGSIWVPPEPPPWELDTDWFDTEYTGDGNFVIAQFTVLPSQPDWVVTGRLQYAAAHTGGELFDYFFTIPEPGTIAAATLGALAVLRRR